MSPSIANTKTGHLFRKLLLNRSGVAAVEFAIALPLFITMATGGFEITRYAQAHMKVSQIALNLADNIARMGQSNASGIQVLYEVHVNDAFEAVRDQGESIGFTRNGRIILSSLENGIDGQRIHWQRCVGLKSGTGYASSYGTVASPTAAGTMSASISRVNTDKGLSVPTGMGPAGAQVQAPPNSGVMFVEANYEFKPLFGRLFTVFGTSNRIHYVASYLVRDNRDFGAPASRGMPLLMNTTTSPAPAPKATCNLYSL